MVSSFRIVSFGLVLNAIGLYLFWRLGQHTSFGALMPASLFGAGHWRQRPRETRSVAWSSQPGPDSALSTHQVAPAAS